MQSFTGWLVVALAKHFYGLVSFDNLAWNLVNSFFNFCI